MSAQPCTELVLLLAHARNALCEHFGLASDTPAVTPALQVNGASFVTLKRDGELRGCVGSVRAFRALVDDVRNHAVAAACRDERFEPVRADELPRLQIEVSRLSEPEFLEFSDEDALCQQLRPGVDGLILFSGCRSATFLPVVWEQFAEPHQFLAALKAKAGLDPSRPTPNPMAARYQVNSISDAVHAA